MRKKYLIILSIAVATFLVMGSVSYASSGKIKVDPFDPAFFNVEEGGIVLKYTVDYHYEENYISSISFSNQFPGNDIRSRFKYSLSLRDGDTKTDLNGLRTGDIVVIRVAPPSDFYDDYDLTRISMEFKIPPVTRARIKPNMITEDVMREFLPQIRNELQQVIEHGYYYRYSTYVDEDGGYYESHVKKDTEVTDIIDPEKIYFYPNEDGVLIVSAAAKSVSLPNWEGKNCFVRLGCVDFTYDKNKDMIAVFCYPVCDENGEIYYFSDDEHYFPLYDDYNYTVDSSDPDAPRVENLAPYERFLDVAVNDKYDPLNRPSYSWWCYSYNYTNNTLKNLHEHKYSSWLTTVKPTELAPGKKVRYCSECELEQTKTIAKRKPSLKAVSIQKLKAAKKSATVQWKKVKQKKTKKIQIQYSKDKKFKKGVVNKYCSAKKTSMKLKALKSKKTYYVRIRAYTKSGDAVHISKWSKTKYVKVK